jgi:hypothetical protein
MNQYFAAEMPKIAKAGYRKRQGVLVDENIPILQSIPKDPGQAAGALQRGIKAVKKSDWSHKQIAVPVKAVGDLKRLGFRTDPMFAIPLPGEKWFSKTWRKGKLHAHRRGPFYVIHADKNPGLPRTFKGLAHTAKHLVQDVPPAVYKRLTGTAKLPVILKPSRKRR